jgi:cell division protease FtsH
MGGGGRLARRVASAAGTRGVLLAPRRHLDALAASTPGMVGADLKNLVNEAALLAARRGESQVTMADFSNSLEKVVLGTVRGIVPSSGERERTAFHESGYALLGMLTPGASPVRKISITPEDGPSASPTSRHRPTATATPRNISAAGSPARWTGTGGGRVGGGDHRRRERHGARQQHRPADRGPLGHVTSDRAGLGAPPPGQESPYGPDGVAQATEELVDTEARKIIEECCGQALATLRGSRDRLDRLAHTLLERKRWTRTTPTPPRASTGETAPAAIARGGAPSTPAVRRMSPAAAQSGAEGITAPTGR